MSNTLWYNKRAEKWTEALPLGNGSLGAMVYGDENCECVQFSKDTMWSGYEQDSDNPQLAEQLPKLRELIFDGKIKEAQTMCDKYFVCKGEGTGFGHGYLLPYGSLETAGELFIDFYDKSPVSSYKRSLDINKAVANVSYFRNGAQIEETIFSSFKNNITVIKLFSESEISVAISFKRLHSVTDYSENKIVNHGTFSEGKGLNFATTVSLDITNGQSITNESGIEVKFIGNLYLYISTMTSYSYQGDVKLRNDEIISDAKNCGFEKLLAENIEYFSNTLNKTEIDFCSDDKFENLATDERIELYSQGNFEDIGLINTYYNYGRYLLLSSSTGDLPSGLQGVWTNDYDTIWSGDYHININLQMNYWLTESTNLSQLNKPMFDYIKMIAKHGEKTAKISYNCRGWVAHTTTNPWGFTSPGEKPSWGSFTCAGAWMVRHLWEHYLYTEDMDFLREFYPIIKNCALFFVDFLVEDPRNGYLVTAPSNSPENSYFDPITRESVAMCAGPTMDNSIISDLFDYTLKSAQLLNDTDEIIDSVKSCLAKLPPIKLGSKGQILEWQEEYDEVEPGHRHISPLYGLHPASLITKSATPHLFEGARKLIELRLSEGGGHTGWSRAWIVNFYARLFDGEEAYQNICELLGKSTLPNMFDTHPPFQIDGNFGGTNGITEMIMQSHEGFINILPALPKRIKQLRVKNLVARGGFEVSFYYNDGKIESLEVKSLNGNKAVIKYKDEVIYSN